MTVHRIFLALCLLACCLLLRLPTACAQELALTPPAKLAPRITGPKVFGLRPDSPCLFRVTAMGARPMTFGARNLPAGLRFDPQTGRVTGRLTRRGTSLVVFTAKNKQGTAARPWRLVVGDRIGLTPALGWNSWNVWGASVDDHKVRDAADAMISSRLADHGYSYINLDDGWQGPRAATTPAPGPLTGDPKKFPDMKDLADYIHAEGLKFGLYSTPRDKSYAGYPGGSVETRQGTILCSVQDVRQFTSWGVDYLKYDGDPPNAAQTAETAEALRQAPRDILYSLSCWAGCGLDRAPQYAALCNSWRMGYDLSEQWSALFQNGFVGLNDRVGIPPPFAWSPYTGPGHFADFDMLLVGRVGGVTDSPHPTHLTPDEQYTMVSQWCLLASPILIGCDLTQLDPFTRGLLTNDDVLDVDQDPLGLQATQVFSATAGSGSTQVWARDLEDGSRAVALYNLTEAPATVTARWADLGLTGPQRVRDLWRQRSLGVMNGSFTASVARHGVVLVAMTPARPGAPHIQLQPISADARPGQSVTFSLKAQGRGPLRYQWMRDGKPIPSAHGPAYTIPAPTADDNGLSLRCIVTNPLGHVTSDEAMLDVLGTKQKPG